jgi:hypothetical protein
MSDPDILHRLASAGFDLAEEALFETVSLRAISDRAGVTLADCAANGVTRARLLAAMDRDADHQMLESACHISLADPARDRLFEIVIGRFDALEARRPAWTSILLAERGDMAAGAARIARRTRTARWALTAAGISDRGSVGLARTAGLSRILRLCEAAWLQDGPDLSATMACLDRELAAGGQVLARLARLRARFATAKADHREDESKGPESTNDHVVH